MPRVPNVYINVHQTIWVMLATGIVVAYISDFKGFRSSINNLVYDISKGQR